MKHNKPEAELVRRGVSCMPERFQRGLQRAFTMKPTHPTPKAKTRPASKGRVHKGKTGR